MVEVRIMKFLLYGSPIPLVFREQVSSRNSMAFPPSGALNEGGVGKIGDFRILSHHISEIVQDRLKLLLISNKVTVGKIGDFWPLSCQYLKNGWS